MIDDYMYHWQYDKMRRLEDRSFRVKNKLRTEVYENAYMVPVEKTDKYMMGAGGVYSSDGTYVGSSAIFSGGSMINASNTSGKYEVYLGKNENFRVDDCVKYRDEEVVYLGHIYNHWGHFLIDFSTRLWYLLSEGKGKKGVFIVKHGEEFALIANIKRFISLLGIKEENIEFINVTTKFKKIIVPEVSYRTNDYYSTEYLNMFEMVAKRIDSSLSYDKVYFTRNSFKKAIKTEFGEKEIEKAFNEAGFVSISPEKCSLDDQISLIRKCKYFAGVSGTITHNLLFAKENQKAIIINKTYIINVMQYDINKMKGLDITYVDAFVSPFPVSLGVGPFMLECNKNFSGLMKNYFEVTPKELDESEKKDKIQRYFRSFSEKYYTEYSQKLYAPEDENSVHYYNPNMSEHWEYLYEELYRFSAIKSFVYYVKSRLISEIKRVVHK